MENPTNPSKSGVGGDKQQVKRDEWSEGAVSSLLQAYEAKWVLRNRAKLKGQDWIEVARFVSAASDAPKTQTQCKNKIESMKKRYRSESASTSASAWPLYEKIHHLLTGHNVNNHAGGCGGHIVSPPQPINTNCSPPAAPSPVPFSVQIPTGQNQNAASALEPNGVVFSPTKDEDGAKLTQSDQGRHNKTVTTDSTSTNPAFNIRSGNKQRPSSSNTSRKRRKKKKNRIRSCGIVIAESVRWLAEAVVRTEEARMETMRELERMRAETEIRRGEMELKRTRIIADTQLEIARLMSGKAGLGTTPSSQPGSS